MEFDFEVLGKWVHSDMKKIAVFGFAFEYVSKFSFKLSYSSFEVFLEILL